MNIPERASEYAREATADLPKDASSSIPSAAPAQLHTPPDLAFEPDILATFTRDHRACGVVGEERNAKIEYLALTSRVLEDPVSVAKKGVSSVGKSITTRTTTKFFPPTAFFEMSAMSERALVYSKDDLAHRTIILAEAVALREQREKTESNLTAFFVRTLLSEGEIRYPVTVRDKGGNFTTKVIVKKGPTNIILTTTATSLHGENETRLLSLPMNDTHGQTKAVMLQLARGPVRMPDFRPWHDLQRWIEKAEHRVEIPFAEELADAIPPVAVRLRRDFRSILRLIETHAILHQETRCILSDGRIVARHADYQTVRGLVADLISDGVGATVSETMRETVECVRSLAGTEGVKVASIAEKLELDRSAVQRRVAAARERGYIVNLEDRRGRPGRYELGEPMPDQVELLPRALLTPDLCNVAGQRGVCRCAATAEEREEPAWRQIQREEGEEPESDTAAALAAVQEVLGVEPA